MREGEREQQAGPATVIHMHACMHMRGGGRWAEAEGQEGHRK